jgi:uncharacterized DUF497 family protein
MSAGYCERRFRPGHYGIPPACAMFTAVPPHWTNFCSYIKYMTTWDKAKRKSNLAKHGVDFALLSEFDWDSADIDEDIDAEHGERREIAAGWIGINLYVYVYTLRGEEDHAISLRKAEKKDYRRYVEKTRALHRR